MSGHDFFLWACVWFWMMVLYNVFRLIDAWERRHLRRMYRLHWWSGRPLK